MTIRQELIDELLQECPNPQKLLREGGVLKELTKALVERCLDAELETHLEDAKRRNAPKSDRRNGHSHKTLKGEFGEVVLEVPRARNGDFEPQLLKKRQTRLEGFDEKVLALYARGMSVRDIQAQLLELYGAEVSPGLISNVTDGVMEEAKTWQARSLEAVYPIVWFDALVVKVRENNRVINKAIHLALGVNLSGTKELLGLWIAQAEGAKFWLGVLTELKNRGVQDVLIACIDGLSGFAEAIETVYPDTRVQLCMVHLVRNSLRYVCYKHRKEVAADLKLIYTAATEIEAELNLELFAEKWDTHYPTISKSWRNHWRQVIPMFVFPQDIRRAIYTTNAIESVNMTLRKVTRNHRIFPNDEAVVKVVYLAIQNIAKKWTMPIKDWKPALNRFAIEFEGRLPA
jgi:putative transposase